MIEKKLQINIFNHDLDLVGLLEEVESFVHRTSWMEIPLSELRVSKEAQIIKELQVGRILVVNGERDKALIIEDMKTSIDTPYIDFTLIPLKGILNYRICHPSDIGNFKGVRQSEVMKQLIEKNLITQTRDNDRKFLNSKGKNLLQVEPIQYAFGDIIDFTVDWNTGYLGDAIVTIAKMYGIETNFPLGWNISINEDYTGFIVQIVYGKHKHINQTELSPVVFSEDFGNIKSAAYEYSIKDWRNVAYMTWNNGTTDTSTTVANRAQGATVGFNRKEIIISSSKKASNEVTLEGRSELNKRPHVESFRGEILDPYLFLDGYVNPDHVTGVYRKDWDLGDIITIQSKEVLKGTTVSIDVQVTEIEEVYASGEYTLNATFGEGKISFVQLIKNSIRQR